MRARPLLLAALLAAAAGAAAGDARAWPAVPPPAIELAAGKTFAVTGEPNGGGASLSIAATWPVMDRLRFGLEAHADDMGSEVGDLLDPNNGTSLGTTARMHRWAWGAAWRAEADAWTLGRWSGGVSGAFGLWRIEDDRLGQTFLAGSAVGLRLGTEARRSLGRGRTLGLALNYHRLDRNEETAWARVDRYASAALALRWDLSGGND